MVKSRSIGPTPPVAQSPLTGHRTRTLPEGKVGILVLTRLAPSADGTRIAIGAFDIIGLHKVGTEAERPCIEGPTGPFQVPTEAEFAVLGISSKVIWVG